MNPYTATASSLDSKPRPRPTPTTPREVKTASIVYVAGLFPRRSETFVSREVMALRERHHAIRTISLHPSPDAELDDLAPLADGVQVGYCGWSRVVVGAIAQALRRPASTAKTVTLALRDAISPGEPTPLRDRLKIALQVTVALSLADRLRHDDVGHVHSHFAHAPTTVAMYLARQLGVPFSFTGHANDLFERRSLLRRKLERAQFASCISEWHRDWYRSVAADTRVDLPIVRCGVDTEEWQFPRDPDASAEPDEAGAPLRVLSVARLVPKKGIDTLIAALAICADQGTTIELTIAGDGPQAKALRAEALAAGVASQVRWLGAVPNDEVRELLRAADVFALPCRVDDQNDRDGIPVVLMEAMAARVAAVAGDLPTVRELIEDDVSGRLIPGDDAASLAAALTGLQREPAERRRLAAAGRARVEEEFDLTINIERLERALASTTKDARDE